MEKLLSKEQVMEMVGIKKSTLYCWVHQKKIPHVKLGRRILRFGESDILNWISNQAVHVDSDEERPCTKRVRPSRRSKAADEYIERILESAKRVAKK